MCIFATGASASRCLRRHARSAGPVRCRRVGEAVARLLLASVLACALAPARAGGPAAAATVYGWPTWSGAAVIYPWYLPPGPCPGSWACAGWGWEDRRPWRRPVAPEQPSFDEQDIWGTTGSPWGYVRRLPPPTPESQIQPAYRDASTIRPEYQAR